MTTFAFEAEIDQIACRVSGSEARVVVRLAGQQLWAAWANVHSGPDGEQDAIDEVMSRWASKLADAVNGS